MSDVNPCCGRVRGEGQWGSFYMSNCRKRATVERQGKHYCGTHDPVKRQARIDKKSEEYKARREAERKTSEWNMAAQILCAGVSTETMEKLGQGWLLKNLGKP